MAIQPAERMNHIGQETAFEVLVRARALEARGRSVVHLEIGEPDFDTPSHIIAAAQQALEQGYTLWPGGWPAGAQTGGRRLSAGVARAEHRSTKGSDYPGRQADHVLRHHGADQSGRRGDLPRSGF